jgi:hypothetical protein
MLSLQSTSTEAHRLTHTGRTAQLPLLPCGDAQYALSLDPVQVTQMAKYLETVYISGWQSSSTASSTNEPGPDLAGAFASTFAH